MNSLVRIFGVAVLATALASGQIVRSYTSPTLVGVPSSGTGGLPGGASNPLNTAQVTTDFPDAIVASYVSVSVYLAHGRVGDLTMTLSHCGTTVTLFSGSANQAASVSGYYTFDDSSPSFGSAVNAAAGLVAPNNYYGPQQSLSAFNGKSSTGPWILTVADLASGVSGSAGFTQITLSAGGSYGDPSFPPLHIPDGNNGSCVDPVTYVVNVPGSGQVGMMTATLDIHHFFASDLTILLSHGGVTVSLQAYNAPYSGADLNGAYTFQDDASSSWAQALVGAGSGVVPVGSYRPLTPLAAFQGLDMAGPWYFTICDQATFDMGIITGAYLTIGPAAWNVQITQPNGAASATVTNSGGRMGDSYANLMTLVPGAFPNGWLHGVDMSLLDVALEVSFGPPFYGQLGPCGSASTTVAGPIPSGLTVYVTGLELDPSGSIVNFKPGFAYVTP